MCSKYETINGCFDHVVLQIVHVISSTRSSRFPHATFKSWEESGQRARLMEGLVTGREMSYLSHLAKT